MHSVVSTLFCVENSSRIYIDRSRQKKVQAGRFFLLIFFVVFRILGFNDSLNESHAIKAKKK